MVRKGVFWYPVFKCLCSWLMYVTEGKTLLIISQCVVSSQELKAPWVNSSRTWLLLAIGKSGCKECKWNVRWFNKVKVLQQSLWLPTGAAAATTAIASQYSPEGCCYGKSTFSHGQTVASIPSCCIYLTCHDGDIKKQYIGQPGDSGCEWTRNTLLIGCGG